MSRLLIEREILALADSNPMEYVDISETIVRHTNGLDFEAQRSVRSTIRSILRELKKDDEIYFPDGADHITPSIGHEFPNSHLSVRSTRNRVKRNEDNTLKQQDMRDQHLQIQKANILNELQHIRREIDTIQDISLEKLDFFVEQTKLFARLLFGPESHFILDINSLVFRPLGGYIGNPATHLYTTLEFGKQKFKVILNAMISEMLKSSNYPTVANLNLQTSRLLKRQEEVRYETARKIPVESDKIHILIASPSDTGDERKMLRDLLETKFRREHYEKRCGKRIIILGWEDLATQPGYGQDTINEQLVKKVDIVLAVFKHKLGSPTKDVSTGNKRQESGTAEELLYAIDNSAKEGIPLGMAYFYSEAPAISFESIDFENDLANWKRLKDFKETISDKILYKTYPSSEQLLNLACEDICNNVQTYFS